MTRRPIPRIRRRLYGSARTLGDANAVERSVETGSPRYVERRLLRRLVGRLIGRSIMRKL